MTKQKQKNRLGDNPLDNLSWIGKDHIESKKEKSNKQPEKEEKREKRETFIIEVELSEKIKDYAYWSRQKQKDVVNHIFKEFFKDTPTKRRPEEDTQ